MGELSLESQLALVRILEDLESELDGREQSARPDVRLIAATHRDLQIANAKGTFLSELFCRLVFPIMVRSLRERREDIPRLAWHFLTYYAEREGKRLPALTGSVMHLLKSYPWPGNLRELQRVMQQFVVPNRVESPSLDAKRIHVKSTSSLVRPISGRSGNGKRDLLEVDLLKMLSALPGWECEAEVFSPENTSRAYLNG